MVHADVQSLSFSFTVCHANESGMDSEIHALARTLDPLSVSLSLLWQMLVRAAVAIVSLPFYSRVGFTPVCFPLVAHVGLGAAGRLRRSSAAYLDAVPPTLVQL